MIASMKKLSLLALSVGLAFGLSACGSSDDLVGKMKSFKDKMCACKDKACAEAVDKEEDAWEETLEKKYKDKEPDQKTMEAFDKVKDEYRACRDKAAGSE
jgi:hypothetical protein